ncbi:MAG: peptide ABC transporter substrate-binding protein, partial [Chloroflexota bacterium]
PGLINEVGQEAVTKQIFTGLVRYKPDLTVEPALAEKWEASPDAKTYTFTLKDTKWSDGTAVTAADFEYAIKRMLDPKFASTYAHFLYDLKGAEAFNGALGTKNKPKQADDATLAKLRDAVGVKALDARTLKFDLENPASYFLSLLAQGNVSPIKKDVVEKFGDKWTEPGNIISNGPFLLKSWAPGSKITLERNPNYFDTRPTLDRIEITFITDDATAYAAYRNGELDISSNIPDALVQQIRQDSSLSKDILQDNTLRTTFLGFDVKAKPFDDKRVRQAFQMALDTKTLNDKVLNGIHTPAKSFIPLGMPGFQPEIGFDFNPAKARQLLAEAGYPDGKGLPKVTAMYATSTANKLRMEYIQAQIKENLGIDIELENVEGKSFGARLVSDPAPMFFLGFASDYPHPNNWLRVAWGEIGSGVNFSQWSNTGFDDLVRKAAAEPDQKRQLDMYAQAQKILVDDAPALWMYFQGRFRLVKPWVKGLKTTPQDPQVGAYFWKDLQIAAH